MPIVGRLDQFGSMLVLSEFDEVSGGNVRISGLGTYYASEFKENVGIAVTLTAFGPGQGTFMRQNTDNTVIVYNEIDEVGLSASLPTAEVLASSTSMSEVTSITFTVNTTNFPSGTLYCDIESVSGTVGNSSDLGVVDSFVISSSTGSIGLFTLPDFTTEGTESFRLRVRTDSAEGTVIGISSIITIADTSTDLVATVTPNITSVNEGSAVTFNVTLDQSITTTLYWDLNTVSGTINESDFVEGVTSGSFAYSSGVGSTTLTLANDVTTEPTTESFQLRVKEMRNGNLTVIGTSATVTVNDTSITSGYTIVSETKAPVFGVNGATTHPPTGWTSQINANADDANIQIPTLPFNFFINNTAFTSVFLGSNSYITFGSGSTEWSNLSVTNPAIPKMMFGAADNSWQRVSTFVSGTDYVRVRYEGNANTSGTVGSPGIVAEITLFNPSKFSGSNVIELLVGIHNRIDGVSNISNASTAFATYTVAANQSYVFVGNSTGTSWTVNTGSKVSGTDY
jgi:hypothetical protein